MILKFCFLFLFFIKQAMGFVLLNTEPPRYPSGHVQVQVVNNQACSNILETPEELIDLINEAVDEFWNTVHTSSISLESFGYVSAGGKDINDILAAANNTIVVGCSRDSYISASSTIAVGGYSYSSGIMRGYVALNDKNLTPFVTLTRRDKVATLAHEIGHALGIGHSEKDFALMYFSTGAVFNYLSQDDADAITYLYPHDPVMGGLGGSCGTIVKEEDMRGPNKMVFWQGPMGFLLGFFLMGFRGHFCRRLFGVRLFSLKVDR
jgi:predicted Zn-dependent protease